MKSKINTSFKIHQISLKLLFLVLISFWSITGKPKNKIDFTKYVNPFIVTSGTGHTYPDATLPLGMLQLSPEINNYCCDYCIGYRDKDSTLIGFVSTHMSGTG